MKHPILRYLYHNQVIAALVLLALVWLIIRIKEILMALFIAYILMAALTPFVNALRRKRVPKSIAVAITYLTTLSLVFLLIMPIVPFFLEQIQSLFLSFPRYIDQAASNFGIRVDSRALNTFINTELTNLGRNAFALTKTVFGGFFSVLTVLVVSFYMLIDRENIKKTISGAVSKEHQTKIFSTLSQIEEKLGAWLRGQLILSLFIGLLTWVVLTLIGLEFALPIAIIAGILEIAPTIGPIISSIPAIIVALTISPTMALIVAGIYIAIQALENNVLVPRIMEKAVGLNPLIIIIGVVIGSELLGVLGALLSVPFISMLIIIFQNLQKTQD